METKAQYFDGRTAADQSVTLWTDGFTLRIRETDTLYKLADVSVVPPVGQGRWAIDLPDGGRCTFINDDFARLIDTDNDGFGWVAQLEGSWHWALLALAVVIVGSWAFVVHGIPAAARHVAFAVPPHVDAALSRDGLRAMDRVFFDPTTLDAARRQHVTRLFSEITATDPTFASYELVFRQSDSMGANAFALPGGVVVMTDDMVRLAESDDELVAVLAHEVGHQYGRHVLRVILQNSTVALFIAGITGDLASISALAASIPTALTQARYSREFEREADAFAFDYLASTGRSQDALRNLLLRLDDSGTGASGAADWFSSHPRSGERMPQ